MASFAPRTAFPNLGSLPRSWFLGHHRAGLNKMKTMLSSIDLVIECRDCRVPITSRNPLFEEHLAGRQRLIVYTKQDLAGKAFNFKSKEILRKWHSPSSALFSDYQDQKSVRKVLEFARNLAISADNLVGLRMMVAGMPNVGKSTLLNALRQVGVRKGKAAKTGAQPGVTRAIGTTVKIIDAEGDRESVYLIDTPGVFIPYIPNVESMLKLALCGSVKDYIIEPVTLADYLLFHINLRQPRLYGKYTHPTNDIMALLDAVGRQTGRLQRGGSPHIEASALWLIQQWRQGNLGKFVLDDVSNDNLDLNRRETQNLDISMNQARRLQKECKRLKSMTSNQDVS